MFCHFSLHKNVSTCTVRYHTSDEVKTRIFHGLIQYFNTKRAYQYWYDSCYICAGTLELLLFHTMKMCKINEPDRPFFFEARVVFTFFPRQSASYIAARTVSSHNAVRDAQKEKKSSKEPRTHRGIDRRRTWDTTARARAKPPHRIGRTTTTLSKEK